MFGLTTYCVVFNMFDRILSRHQYTWKWFRLWFSSCIHFKLNDWNFCNVNGILFRFRSTCNAHKNKQLWLNIWVGLCMLGSNPCMNNNIQIGFLTNILTILIFIFHDGLNTKLIIRLKNIFIPVLDLLVSYVSSWIPSIIIVVISV